jgi:hypothetical protein
MKKFSECVEGFASLWIEWNKHNDIAISSEYPYEARRKHAIKAERLLNKRYKLIQTIDLYFKMFDGE